MDTSGSPGLLGGGLALSWFGIMTYGPLATWGATPLLTQPPGFLVMLAAAAVFPALGLWMIAGAWRTAWLANHRIDRETDLLHAELRELRADIAGLTDVSARLLALRPQPEAASRAPDPSMAPVASPQNEPFATPAPKAKTSAAPRTPMTTPAVTVAPTRPRTRLDVASLTTTLSLSPAAFAAPAALHAPSSPVEPTRSRSAAPKAAAPEIRGFVADAPAQKRPAAPRKRKPRAAAAPAAAPTPLVAPIAVEPAASVAPEPPPVARRPAPTKADPIADLVKASEFAVAGLPISAFEADRAPRGAAAASQDAVVQIHAARRARRATRLDG